MSWAALASGGVVALLVLVWSRFVERGRAASKRGDKAARPRHSHGAAHGVRRVRPF